MTSLVSFVAQFDELEKKYRKIMRMKHVHTVMFVVTVLMGYASVYAHSWVVAIVGAISALVYIYLTLKLRSQIDQLIHNLTHDLIMPFSASHQLAHYGSQSYHLMKDRLLSKVIDNLA